jgi:hypothetical protein
MDFDKIFIIFGLTPLILMLWAMLIFMIYLMVKQIKDGF